MLARIAQELYWIGRRLSRAEHTARMLDAVFHADLQARPDNRSQERLSWDSILAVMGAESTDGAGGPASREATLTLMTLDPDEPASILHCVTRAREGARTVRDVFSAEMWEAINTFDLELRRQDMNAALRAGPYSVYSLVRERCGLFWGVTRRTMLRDEANAFLEAGAAIEAADMVLRMLRVALPVPEEEGEVRQLDGQALAVLQAVGGLQAYRRAVPAAPLAAPVTRFLLYERAYPDAVASWVEVLHDALYSADENARSSPAVLRVGRLMADLEFRARAVELEGDLQATLRLVQRELAQVDEDIVLRYFGGTSHQLVTA